MTNILGVGFMENHEFCNSVILGKLLTELLYCGHNNVKAGETSGVAFVTEQDIAILKDTLDFYKFKNDNRYKKAVNDYIANNNSYLYSIMLACGDKTFTKENHDSVQPITCGKVVGIHQGKIINHKKLFESFKATKIEKKLKTSSEIIFSLIDYFVSSGNKVKDAIKTTSDIISGDAVCAFVHASSPYILWIFKQYTTNKITILHYSECGVIMFASKRQMIDNAIKYINIDFGTPNVININHHECVGINLKTNKYDIFNLMPENASTFNSVS